MAICWPFWLSCWRFLESYKVTRKDEKLLSFVPYPEQKFDFPSTSKILPITVRNPSTVFLVVFAAE